MQSERHNEAEHQQPWAVNALFHYYVLIKSFPLLNHFLELVGQIRSTRAVSSWPVVTWSGCPS